MESLEFDIQRVSGIDCQNIPDYITLHRGYSKGVNRCLASHIVCMQMFLSEENAGDRCLITKDDLSAEYVPYWGKKHWDVYNGHGNTGCDILQLGCLGEYSNSELEPIQRQKQFSTVAYIINRATAKRIVTATGTGTAMNLNHLTCHICMCRPYYL